MGIVSIGDVVKGQLEDLELEVGVLRGLLEADVRADLLVGASVGAVNAAHFAGCADLDGIERSALDFGRAPQLMDEAHAFTQAWLEGGGLDTRGVPRSLRVHSHEGRPAAQPPE